MIYFVLFGLLDCVVDLISGDLRKRLASDLETCTFRRFAARPIELSGPDTLICKQNIAN